MDACLFDSVQVHMHESGSALLLADGQHRPRRGVNLYACAHVSQPSSLLVKTVQSFVIVYFLVEHLINLISLTNYYCFL